MDAHPPGLIPIRLLGFEGETVLNSVSENPPWEYLRPRPVRPTYVQESELESAVLFPVERYRADIWLGPDDGGPLVIYHRVE